MDNADLLLCFQCFHASRGGSRGRQRGVRQILMLADKGGGGVENRQNSADIVYGRPLMQST